MLDDLAAITLHILCLNKVWVGDAFLHALFQTDSTEMAQGIVLQNV